MKRLQIMWKSTQPDVVAPGIPGGDVQGDGGTVSGSRRAFSIRACAMNRIIVGHVVRSAARNAGEAGPVNVGSRGAR